MNQDKKICNVKGFPEVDTKSVQLELDITSDEHEWWVPKDGCTEGCEAKCKNSKPGDLVVVCQKCWDSGKTSFGYITKDSGKRQEFSTGMVRDVQEDKPRYDLLDMPMLKRWADLMARGAKKYGEENWRKAATEEELKRFKASALRHLLQWFNGDVDEDHAAAVYFNIAGAEMTKEKLHYV